MCGFVPCDTVRLKLTETSFLLLLLEIYRLGLDRTQRQHLGLGVFYFLLASEKVPE